ncbi:elongation factor P--(R)-beta-lysine ligase [Thalassotalea sp. ND16A]|uniref:elongation factor P--(R)-beta-lysine ligase n=1 Tax=Thalassotalea sp. ND16A TaxID=1535422 RepID=UPI00051A02F6|nr:elongation factor P--(R)-beta-lysine ligase [Thalassotalea sp. ND16A]KGJ87881.1 Lysine--tRNA ligase [Thalassotalea sp. ND16A]
MNWQASANLENLKKRAEVLATIRTFFAERNVLEVDTQALSHATVTDLHLVSFETQFLQAGANKDSATTLYLQTSPEFAMKRLLASGSGCIYQICKAFRNEESGRFHNPEFTILEWYREEFDHFELMKEVSRLVERVLKCRPAEQFTYQQVFSNYVGVDPLHCTIADLQQAVLTHQLHADWVLQEHNLDTLLQYLFTELVEPKIGQNLPCFIYNFPASQAALAKISGVDNRVAERFELYFKGIELANGFHELTNSVEQKQRFEADNRLRQRYNLQPKPIDENLLQALTHGLPNCAGVALGIDRLVMLTVDACAIDDVIAFPVNRA